MKNADVSVDYRSESELSPYVSIVLQDIRFGVDKQVKRFHHIKCYDYVAIVALTRSGHVPIVSQHRVAVGETTWELPAGLCDQDLTPAEHAVNELREECGLEASRWIPLPPLFTDTGRIENKLWSFVALDCVPSSTASHQFGAHEDEGLTTKMVRVEDFILLAEQGGLSHAGHLGVVLMARQFLLGS